MADFDGKGLNKNTAKLIVVLTEVINSDLFHPTTE
jgi:hypothetical protein